RSEIELLDDDLPARVAHLRLREADARDLGRAVRDARDVHVVDRWDVGAGDPLGDGDPLREGDVRELERGRRDVPARPDPVGGGPWAGGGSGSPPGPRPRSSIEPPAASRPRSSVTGPRPTATRQTSAVTPCDVPSTS